MSNPTLAQRLAAADDHADRVLDKIISRANLEKTSRDYQRGFEDGIAFIKRCIARGESLEEVAPTRISVDQEREDEIPPDPATGLPLAILGQGDYTRTIRHDARTNRIVVEP